MNVLLLAGTGDAIAIAAQLTALPGVKTTASFAGRTTHPVLPPGVNARIGGFGGVEGLRAYLAEHAVDAVIDATHPFAQRMHRNAAAACAGLKLPIISYLRPEWTPSEEDRVLPAEDMAAAAALAREHGRRIFLTVGRQELKAFAPCEDRWFLIRSIEEPPLPLPPHRRTILERGPFTREHELRLMREHGVDLIVSKNSVGEATYAKIEAARTLRLPVVLVRRPPRTEAPVAQTYHEIISWTNSLLLKDIFLHEAQHI